MTGTLSEKTLFALKPARGNLKKTYLVNKKQQQQRHPNGASLKQHILNINVFPGTSPFTPKKITSERKLCLDKHMFRGVWRTWKCTQFEMLWRKTLGPHI